MFTAIFVICTIICGIGWLVYWVASAALVKMLLDRGYDVSASPELAEELRKCIVFVVKHLLHIK